MLRSFLTYIRAMLTPSPRPHQMHAGPQPRCGTPAAPIRISDRQFTYEVTLDALSTNEWLHVDLRAGGVGIILNTNHPAAQMLLSGKESPSLNTHTALLCAAVVALEIEAPNLRRARQHHDARVDIGRILRRMYHHSKEQA
jgi:hypothetical protein